MGCAVPAAGVHRAADLASEQMDQLLFGETFEVIEEAEAGFLWGQARRDGYVGFVAAAALGPPGPEPTHRICAPRTYAFAEPSIKSRASGPYSMNALVAIEAEDGRLRKVVGAGWMAAEHLAPIGAFETDVAGVAERFLGAPYLWGGRESLGLDCSGLVQQALFACGMACPRDADQQAGLGRQIGRKDFGRGDLVFWRGHVAIGLDETRIVHANGHHMMVAIEPLETAIGRIDAAGVGQPTGFRRL
jgi:cell wall-associated NlpC family hydrolase